MKGYNEEKKRIEIPCNNGLLCAEIGVNQDYLGIFLYLERPDDIQIDLAAAEADPENGEITHEGGVHVYLYEDTGKDEWTKRIFFSKEELEIEA